MIPPSLLVTSLGMGADCSSTARNFLTRPPTGTPRRAIIPCEGLLLPSLGHHTFSPNKEVAGLSFTACIGRAPFHRARSASKKDGLATPFPSFGGRALREHRRSSGSIPSYCWIAESNHFPSWIRMKVQASPDSVGISSLPSTR